MHQLGTLTGPGGPDGERDHILVQRQRTDQRIDIFSFSATCYEAYTNRQPWQTPTNVGESFDTVLQHINMPPADIRKLAKDIDEQVAKAIMKGIASHPDDRWPTMRRMVNELREAAIRLNQLPEE